MEPYPHTLIPRDDPTGAPAPVAITVIDPDTAVQAARSASRAVFVRQAALAGGAFVAGGILMAGLPRILEGAAAPSPQQDIEILNFALLLEQIQAAFYAEGVRRAAFGGELGEFVRIVADHERAHVEDLTKRLGSAARTPPRFDFSGMPDDAAQFAAVAIMLEDTGVAAYNGQAPNLTRGALAAAARIISVDARHAAWIRSILGRVPASQATDPPRPVDAVLADIRRTGLVKGI